MCGGKPFAVCDLRASLPIERRDRSEGRRLFPQLLHRVNEVVSPGGDVKLESLLQYLDQYLSVPQHPDYPTALNGLQVAGRVVER